MPLTFRKQNLTRTQPYLNVTDRKYTLNYQLCIYVGKSNTYGFKSLMLDKGAEFRISV